MPAKTEPQEVPTILKKVTVFQDRAQLYRHAPVSLKAGEHTLTFGGIWNRVDRNTLQVAVNGKDSETVVLRAVQFTTIRSVEDVRPLRAKFDAELKPLEEEALRLQDQIDLAKQTGAAYDAVLAKVVSTQSEEFSESHTDPSSWFEVMEFASAGAAKQYTILRTSEKALTEVKRKIQSLKDSKRNLGYSDVRQTTKDVAEVQLRVPKDVDIILELSYITQGPSWTPTYDLRVDSKAKTMSMTYNAIVKQSTAENWEDVLLELSTAKSHLGAEPPTCSPWYVNYEQPRPQARMAHRTDMQQMAQLNFMPMSNMMQQMAPVASAPAPGGAPPPPPPVTLASDSAQVTQSSTSATYTIAGRTTVKADGQPVRVTIVAHVYDAYFRYSAVPKLSTHTYLKVRCTNNTQYQLLPGKTNVFADNQFVSNSDMSLVAPNEEFWTFLGVDDSIATKRDKVYRKVSNESKWMSKTQLITYKYVFTASNMKKDQSEEVVIWDQLPIVEDKKITFHLVTPSGKPGEEESGKVGGDPKFFINNSQFIEWFVMLKPQEERQFFLEFTLEAPQEERLMNA